MSAFLTIDRGDEAVEAAKDEAAALAGRRSPEVPASAPVDAAKLHEAVTTEHVLRGRKGNAAYLVYAGKAESGLVATDVILAGA
jgi:hypothetical protein